MNEQFNDYESKKRIICFDVETTGLDSNNDEILQLSIINGNNEILFNEYIKPINKLSWKEAEKINHISYDMVKDKKTISQYVDTITAIFEKADVIVGYNNLNFDNNFLENAGIRLPDNAIYFDVMLNFAPIYGEYNPYYQDYKWQNLATCCHYYNYNSDGTFHDSLEDVKATLYCFFKIIEEENIILDLKEEEQEDELEL